MLLLLASLLLHFTTAAVTDCNGSAGLGQQHEGREVSSFNFGWRWRRDRPDAAGPASCPSLAPHNGLECPGLSQRRCAQSEFPGPAVGIPCNDTSTAGQCEMDCCADPGCGLWAWRDTTDGSNRCWWASGKNTSGCTASDGWVGGTRPIPAARMGPLSLAPSAPEFDDSAWEGIDVPHDARLTEQFDLDLFRGPGKLPFSTSWYRKKFRVPEAWAHKPLFVTFGGVMRAAHVYLNGKLIGTHEVGYTAFSLRLDNQAGLLQTGNATNVLAVFADDRFSSWDGIGWWYSGAGIYRDVTLTSFASELHLALNGGVFAVASIPEPATAIQMHQEGNGTAGLLATRVDINVTLEFELTNDELSRLPLSELPDTAAAAITVAAQSQGTVSMTVVSQDGKVCGSSALPIPPAASAAGSLDTRTTGSTTVSHTVSVANAELWSVPRPFLYTLVVQLANPNGEVIDILNTTLGLRTAQFREADGLHVNEQRVRLKGFCNHNDFTGVGIAVPPRINLFRAQALREVGANAWRMSHNPGTQSTYDILDRLGILVWDETRQLGTDPVFVQSSLDMVRAHRNNPSVVVYSMCNEGHCQYYDWDFRSELGAIPLEASALFRDAIHAADYSRPASANMVAFGNKTMSINLDVQGFSHGGGHQGPQYRAAGFTKPVVNSECCSCRTLRGAYSNTTDMSKGKLLTDFTAVQSECMASQTSLPLSNKMIAGSFIWTLFDYMGEPGTAGPGQPGQVSSSFGAYDLAGFPKAAASWFKTWWHDVEDVYEAGDVAAHDRPPVKLAERTVSLLDVEFASEEGRETTAYVYSSATTVELLLDGQTIGPARAMPRLGSLNWTYSFGRGSNLTAVGRDLSGDIIGTDSKLKAGAAASISLSVDVPSPSTGTGDALIADGTDVALIRATILDAAGHETLHSGANISFEIVSGAGRVIGVGNGDPACTEPNVATWRSSYKGLTRAIVQVSRFCSSSDEQQPKVMERFAEIDVEGSLRTGFSCSGLGNPIRVRATSPGLGSSNVVSVAISTDHARDGVLQTASRNVVF